MSNEIAMRCDKCRRRWDPRSVNATWAPCVCGNSTYSTVVAFGDFPDGSQVAAEWLDMPDLTNSPDGGEAT